MDSAKIRAQIKDIIGRVTGLDPARIGDDATLRDELNIDSLSLLEIGVDVDLAFKLGLPDERYKEIDSVSAMVALVQQRLLELTAQPQVSHAHSASPRSA
ncbi:MAG TPA: acyl carrier protein [Thermoanaerobaculia bacterium]|nr:acyl carrier protein [Thermoanaerobaculia bacterium]